jgi:hypothetical protein
MADDGAGGLFSGIGSTIGSGLASDTIGQGIGAVGNMVGAGVAELQPYNNMGIETMPAVKDALLGDSVGSNNIGQGRINATDNPVDFENFAKSFTMSPGAQYDLQVGQTAQDNSAAAKGGLLSGANARAQTGIAEGIANKDLLSQYQAMLSGQSQDFSQREASFGNLFGQEGLGEKAAGSQANTLAIGAHSIGGLYGQQATAQQNKGSGIGSALGGVGSLLAK